MKKTVNMIESLMEIQSQNALHSDSNISFGGNIALNVLRQVKESLEGEIVTCGQCLSFLDMDELIRQGTITSDEAEKEASSNGPSPSTATKATAFTQPAP